MSPYKWRFERKAGGQVSANGSWEPDRCRLLLNVVEKAWLAFSLIEIRTAIPGAYSEAPMWRQLERHMLDGQGPLELTPYAARIDTQGGGWLWIPMPGDSWK